MDKNTGFIINHISNIYDVKSKQRVYHCSAKGKFKKEEVSPVVGDRVEIEIISEETKEAVIAKILDRKTYIKRPKIANVSQIIFVLSTKMPKPDLLMLDKQLAFAEYSKIHPIIIMNKIDLDHENITQEINNTYSSIGYKTMITNAKDKKGIQDLHRIIKK